MSIVKNNLQQQNITKIKNYKNSKKITMITAYDALFAKLFEENVDMILVGDSLNMSFAGKEDTLSATLDQMIYHTKAVCRGAINSFIILDMPFGSYTTKDIALKNAIKVYQQTNANAIKIEGGKSKAHIINYLTQNSIAVIGHIGLLPQSVRSEGGYKVRGKTQEDIEELICDAIAVEEAGAFAIILEAVKPQAAKLITKAVKIPVIGIGSGNETDGQILVWSDMLGLFEDFKPKFVKHYLKGAQLIKNALNQYKNDVQNSSFPSKEEEY